VLVTGSNRSGTTWVGRMLCASREMVYVHEPFNPGIWPRWMAHPVPARDLYVCDENEDGFLEDVQAVVERRFPVVPQLVDARTPRDAARLARDAVRWNVVDRRHAPTLLKDPIAVFSSAWLAARFELHVVVMVRSPVAYASSIKRLGWRFDFDNWLRQDLLVRDHLQPFLADLERARSQPLDLIEQAILQWNVVYDFVDRMRAQHPEWNVVIHEDLASSPEAGFAALYEHLGLRFDARARDAVERSSAASNVKDVAPGDKGGIRRDSRSAVESWRHRLTPEEISMVRKGTAEVAARFYEDVRGATGD
jgi:hypothetical protein